MNSKQWRDDLIRIFDDLASLNNSPDKQIAVSLSDELKKLFIDFASATPDNLGGVENIDVDHIVEDSGHSSYEIVTKENGFPLVDIIRHCEGVEIPEKIRLSFPDIQQSEWDGCFRIVTLILLIFKEA